jgi:uncharacterized protein (TIRG00374 family)
LSRDTSTRPPRRIARKLLLLAKAVITALLFWALLTRTPFEELASRMRGVDLTAVAASVAVLFMLTVTTAIRWKIVLRRLGAEARFVSLWHYVMVGGFFNQFLPSGMGGDIFRIWYVRRSGTSIGLAVASVVVDRMLGLLALFVVVVLGLPYLLEAAEEGPIRNLMLLMAAALALCIAAFLRMDLLVRNLRRIPGMGKFERMGGRVRRLLDGVERTAAKTRSMLRAWPDGSAAIALSLTNQVVVGLVVLTLARGVGDGLEVLAAVFIFPYVFLLSMLPISFSGWGLREGAMVVAFALVGMPAASALTVSILFGLCALAASLPGGLLWMRSHLAVSDKEIAEIERGIEAAE